MKVRFGFGFGFGFVWVWGRSWGRGRGRGWGYKLELGLGLVRVRGSIATSAPAAPCRAVQPLKLAMVASAPDASRDCTCSSAPGVENARLRNAGRASAFPWALRAREGEREGEQTPECPSCGAPKGHLQRAAPPASAARISAVSPLSSTAAVRTGAAENVRLVNGWRWWWGRRRAPCVSTTRSAIRSGSPRARAT